MQGLIRKKARLANRRLKRTAAAGTKPHGADLGREINTDPGFRSGGDPNFFPNGFDLR